MKAVESRGYVIDVSLRHDKEVNENQYPFTIPAIKNLDRIDFHPKITFLIGENGSGKSTLLEAVAISLGLNPEGGSKNFRFGTRESHSQLHQFIRVAKGIKKPRDMFFLRAESYFNVGTEIEKLDEDPTAGPPVSGAYGGRSLHEQSHGESFLALLTKRFFGKGLYLLDEPEAALSPTRQLAALRRIHDLIEDSSQFVICTHSPILMAYPGAWIYHLSENGIQRVNYKDTEHYAVTMEFLSHPEKMIEILFEQ